VLKAANAAQPAAEPVATTEEVRSAIQQAALALEDLDGPGYLIGGVMHHRISLLLPMLNKALASLYTTAQPAAECKAGGPCRWRGNASAQFLAAHDAAAQQQEPVAWIESPYGAIRANPKYRWEKGPTTVTYSVPLYTHPSQDAKDAARYRDDLISCRGMVKTELNHYERLALVHGKTAVAENYEKEAQRLSDLLDRIDAAMKETP
jgi:hypothetical protein